MEQSVLRALQILAGAGIDADALALGDEQRHFDLGAGLERGGLGAFVAVLPAKPGSVWVTSSTTNVGGSTLKGLPL